LEFAKRKYIQGTIHNPANTGNRYVIVYDWGVVRINLSQISEIEEYESSFLYYTLKKSRKLELDDDMDYASIESFACFAFGKKILLTEKWESLRESVSGNLTYINLEKITMTNGVSYITIV
tara:strand:- start:280 stop:642 length:363 start_codon:yes stop_codon:yes gene_type:complete